MSFSLVKSSLSKTALFFFSFKLLILKLSCSVVTCKTELNRNGSFGGLGFEYSRGNIFSIIP